MAQRDESQGHRLGGAGARGGGLLACVIAPLSTHTTSLWMRGTRAYKVVYVADLQMTHQKQTESEMLGQSCGRRYDGQAQDKRGHRTEHNTEQQQQRQQTTKNTETKVRRD